MNRNRLFLLSAVLALSSFVYGCVALVAGAAGGAGTYRWASGKLTFTTSHGINECHSATISAFKDLDITLVSERVDQLAGKIEGRTATGSPVKVDLEPQGRNVTKLDIRVGFWGNETQEIKVADAIKRHLE